MEIKMKEDTALIVIGVVVVIGVLGLIFYLLSQPKSSSPNTDAQKPEELRYNTTLQAYDSDSGARIYSVDYDFAGDNFTQKGTLWENVKEEVKNLSYGNYTFHVKEIGYYDAVVPCDVSLGLCNIYLNKHPYLVLGIVQVNENEYRIFLDVRQGTLVQPFICVGKNTFRLVNTRILDLAEEKVPKRLSMYYDKCYDFKATELKPLFYYYTLMFDVDGAYKYDSYSEIKVLVGDQYDLTQTMDVDVPDKIMTYNLNI